MKQNLSVLAVKRLIPGLCLAAATTSSLAQSVETPSIRSDHPRLFLNQESLPAIRSRAQTGERAHFLRICRQVDELKAKKITSPEDLGIAAAKAAFVYLVTEDKAYKELALNCLDLSLEFYENRFAQRRAVSWYSLSRLHAIIAWDWLYNETPSAHRDAWMQRMIRLIEALMKADPPIPREHLSTPTLGFYGIRNLLWYAGVAANGTGIEPELADRYLDKGYRDHLQLLDYRRKAAGDDGSPASATITYALGAYPWTEYNFLYSLEAATGKRIAAQWPHIAMQLNYLFWNWIPSPQGPLHYGSGDTDHLSNLMLDQPEMVLYSHLANIRHFYGASLQNYAAMAEYLQKQLPAQYQTQPDNEYFFYPFLQTEITPSRLPFNPPHLPLARYFKNAGQVFLRSGSGQDDTYALFACGGTLALHRHYDNLSFTIYHKGFLALDSGTRWQKQIPTNFDHLINYYSQSVAHNTLLIHQPSEPPSPFWGQHPAVTHGGQLQVLGSELKAFESDDRFVYAAGDGTTAYQYPSSSQTKRPNKAEQVTRQLIFISPSYFIIFDRVIATDASYRKEWLLHTANEPLVDGKTVRADHQEGRLFCRTLLPADATLKVVGGAGHEFTAGGRNWGLEGARERLSQEQRAMMGQWRIEVSPSAPRKSDLFLHIIQVGDQTLSAMDNIERLDDGETCGLRLTTARGVWTVHFNTTGPLGGHVHLRDGDTILINKTLPQTVAPQSEPERSSPLP